MNENAQVDTFQQAELYVYVDEVLHARRIFQPEDEIPLGEINAFSEQTGDLSPNEQIPVQDRPSIEIQVSWFSFYPANANDSEALPRSISRLTSLQSSQAFLPAIKSEYRDVVFRSDWLQVNADLIFEPYME